MSDGWEEDDDCVSFRQQLINLSVTTLLQVSKVRFKPYINKADSALDAIFNVLRNGVLSTLATLNKPVLVLVGNVVGALSQIDGLLDALIGSVLAGLFALVQALTGALNNLLASLLSALAAALNGLVGLPFGLGRRRRAIE